MKRRLLFALAVMFSVLGMQAEKYKDYDVFYARGGLVGVGNWEDTQAYPLIYDEESGLYEGNVDVVYYTMDEGLSAGWWGARGDLFFQDPSGATWSCGSTTDRFITPATGERGLKFEQNGTANVFQCMGGTYHIMLDPAAGRLTATGVDPKWEDFVFVQGTLPGHKWDPGYTDVRLLHAGEGVYTGTVELEAGDSGYGEFLFHAALHGMDDGHYVAQENGTMVRHGETVPTGRYYGGNAFWANPGVYEVTLNANEQTVALRDITLTYLLEEVEQAAMGLDCDFIRAVADNAEATADEIAWATAWLHLAKKAIATQEYLAGHPDVSGPQRMVLEEYLGGTYEPGEEGYPNGSFLYLWEQHTLDVAAVQAEMAYIDQLLDSAVKNSIAEGSDLTAMLKNADLRKADGWNLTCQGPVGFGVGDGTAAEFWNCTSFEFYQTIEDIPNGVYELSFNALFRPNYVGDGIPAEIVPVKAYMQDWAQSVPSLGDDGADAPLSDDYAFTESGYVPNNNQAACLAFDNGRYAQKVYGVVADGKLTLGFRYDGTRYRYDNWFMLKNLKLTYLGQTPEAADQAVASYERSRQRVEAAFESYFDQTLKTQLAQTLETAAAAATYDEKLAATQEADRLLKQIDRCTALYASMTEQVELYLGMLYLAADEDPSLAEKAQEASLFTDAMWEKVLDGSYTTEEAEAIYNEYRNKWRQYDVIYACGGLQGTGNWESTRNYPLRYNVETGCYEGEVKFDARVMGTDQWGHRCDLFFLDRDLNRLYFAADALNHFLTPTTGAAGLPLTATNQNTTVQAVSGVWQMSVDPDKMMLTATCSDPQWIDYVYVGGTVLQNNKERFEIENYSLNQLPHKGDGVYEGECTLYAGSTGQAEFCVLASTYGASDAWYSTVEDGAQIECGREYAVPRNYNHKMYIGEGRYHVTFNIDRQTMSLDYLGPVEGGGTEIVDVIYCRGGLEGVGDWAANTFYPLNNYGDGKYTGTVKIHPNRTTRECVWGNRADLFFEKSDGTLFGAPWGSRFVTPAKNHFEGMSESTSNVYQCHGGTYKVVIDLEAQTVDFTCLEQAWMDQVFAIGSLEGHDWEREDETYALNHAGEGVYKGIINVTEDYGLAHGENPQSGKGQFAIFACYASCGDWAEGRYAMAETAEAAMGTSYDVSRYNGEKSVIVPVGTYAVTFDMNHETLLLAESSGIQGVELEDGDMVKAYSTDGRLMFEGRMGDLRAKGGVYIVRGQKGSARKQAVK